MKFFAGVTLAALATMVSSLSIPVNVNRDAPSPIEVSLAPLGNSGVTATIKNNGAENLNLLKRGTLLDDMQIQKLGVFSGEDRVAFSGIKIAIASDNLGEGAFQPIKAGETITMELDSGELHDLSTGGKFKIQAKGVIPYAPENSTILSGSGFPFESNTVEIDVDGTAAQSVFKSFQSKMKRSTPNADCQGAELDGVTGALADCARIAAQAAGVVRDGDAAKVEEYFRASDADTRSYVAGRFDQVAAECASSPGGLVNVHCTTPDPCEDGVLAFAYVGGTDAFFCPAYHGLPQLSGDCHAQDKMGTMLHELTHTGVFNPPTEDFVYFYENLINLPADQAKNNADTYSVFANAVNVGC